jgi:membrane associated rhomboid family serine protease
MLIPFGTDAPIYHWPKGTVGLIVANVLSFLLLNNHAMAVEFGTLNPLQWITSLFAHANLGHLIGNMIFLWAFGIVVEGKVGWWKFLSINLLIGAAESAIGQVLMLGSNGSALGASAAIFGLLAVAMVWAPENNLQFYYVFVVLFVPFWGTVEISLMIVGFIYIAQDFFWTVMTGFQMSSYLAHFTGAVIGAGVGVAMLKYRRVDCEGFDLLAVMNGTVGQKPLPTIEQEKELQIQKARRIAQLNKDKSKIADYIESGHFEMAMMKLSQVKKLKANYRLPKKMHWQLITGLIKQDKIDQGLASMEDFIDAYPENKNLVLINMAKIYCQSRDQPRNAMATLARIDGAIISAKENRMAESIKQLAFAKIKNGSLDVNTLKH